MKMISEVASEFRISTRTIRYYEEIGLLKLKRASNGQRVLSNREIAKLKLIMRGKRYGFTLVEIKEMVLLFDKDRSGKKQLERTIEYGQEKLKEIDEKIAELQGMKDEMENLLFVFQGKLTNLQRGMKDE